LIAAAHTEVANRGVQMSWSKVRRMVQMYERQAQRYGYDFGRYLDTQIAMEMQRRVVADELVKVTAYRDPVGEAAVNRVLRGGR